MRRFYPVFIDDIFYYVIGYGIDISELKNSTSTYNDNGTAPNLLSFNGGINVGDVVNVYMVYINDNVK